MISCGIRETIRYLVQHKLVSIITTTAGGIEEDFIKCLAPSYMGDFHLKGSDLRAKGLNRIGNMIVPNNNYCLFETWIMPILDKMREEQKAGTVWTPSKMIRRLGLEINNEESVYYWAAKNDIPIMCPGITDGSIGDMLYMHGYNTESIVLDIVQDLRVINDLAFNAKRSGMIILGGGLPKHHTCNANMIRNGADYAVYINTGIEHEGSDSGASPDEAVSWGKIKGTCVPVKLYSEASLVFPLVVAESFVKYKLRQDKA
jgi:deoxyhypusine synthase